MLIDGEAEANFSTNKSEDFYKL